ncbi:MAG TPA: hypothetical protein VJY65_03885 [Chloroflexota bacterium]|nr:hypothetical protein [Chloroflexota bacterium]
MMTQDQRETVFGGYVEAAPPAAVEAVEGATLLGEVERFQEESLAGAYYAPFAINSKNFMHIPDKTRAWFRRLGELLETSCRLTAQGEHQYAASCFRILYELIDAMERGQEIVFADEFGSWMIPGNEQEFIVAYMTSLAATATPDDFTAAALPLIRRDRTQSFATQAYLAAIRAATEEQRVHLEAEIQRQRIPTGPEP